MNWPRRFAFLAAATLFAPAAMGAPCTGTPPNYAASNGGFGVLDGQMYTPDGLPFVPHGIGVSEYDEPSASQILAKFPGTNLVRLAIFDYASAASLTPYVNDLTSHGIFVELEDHTDSTGRNSGGSAGYIYTGQSLATMLAWYSATGAAFKNNPYVGFGTKNEPSQNDAPSPGYPSGKPDAAGLSNEQLQTYNAIRNAGNNGLAIASPPTMKINRSVP